MAVIEDFGATLNARGVSAARAHDQVRVLHQLAAFLSPRSLCDANGEDLGAHLAQRSVAGYAAGTVAKERQMALSFFFWAYEMQHISAEAFLSLKSVPTPAGATSRIRPVPYKPKELRKFRELLNVRWPVMDDARAMRFVERWGKGVTPYARIRKHAIRLQLDAVISLALHCGLRRGEIFALSLDDMHYDNAFVVVRHGEGRSSTFREVPFTKIAKAAVKDWIEFRTAMGVGHEHPWLNLWAEKTAREPIKFDAFARLPAGYVAPGLSYRRLRHTCGIGWLKAGMNLWEVQRFLGHSSLADTLPYGEAMKADLERRVERLEGSFAETVAPAA
jgi:integrase